MSEKFVGTVERVEDVPGSSYVSALVQAYVAAPDDTEEEALLHRALALALSRTCGCSTREFLARLVKLSDEAEVPS